MEEIGKKELLKALGSATHKTRKGKYHKTRHAPELLERIRPDVVRKRAPHCERLFDVVGKLIGDVTQPP